MKNNFSHSTHMTLQEGKKTIRKTSKAVTTTPRTNKLQNEALLNVPKKRTRKAVEIASQTNEIDANKENEMIIKSEWNEVATPLHHKIHHRIRKSISHSGSAWQRVKSLLFSTPALAIFSLMMGLSLWSDYQTENVGLSASLGNLSQQITTQWGSGALISPDISIVPGVPGSDILDFVFNKSAKDVKEVKYSLVYDQKKLQFSENLPHFEGCSVDSESVQPMLLNIVMRCNKSHDFEKDVPVISHAFTHVNNSQNENITINVVNIEFSTKDGSTYELAGKSYDLLWRSKGY